MSVKIALTLIITLGVGFRLLNLTSSPPGLNWDETSIGYNAYSILETGKDEWGESMPLSFKAFGEHKLPAMIYATVPAIWIFGPDPLAIRLTSAVIGVLGVFGIYLLSTQILKSPRTSLFATLLFAISPLAIHFSRTTFEAGMALTLTIYALYFLLRSPHKAIYLCFSALLAVVAFYTYNSVRILLPLLFITYLSLRVVPLYKKYILHYFLIIILGISLVLPATHILLSQEGQTRLNTVAFFLQPGYIYQIEEARNTSNLHPLMSRLIYNKITYTTTQFLQNYTKSFSPTFLFWDGSTNTQRSIQGYGLLHLFEIPLLILGAYQLFKDKRLRKVILPILILAPIPSAITIDAPSTVRMLPLLIPFALTGALGLEQVILKLRHLRVGHFALAVIVGLSLFSFARELFITYPSNFSRDWQYGHREAFIKIKSFPADRYYITTRYGEPYIFLLFNTSYSPGEYQSSEVKRVIDPLNWVHVESFDKYHFTDFTEEYSFESLRARHEGERVIVLAEPGVIPLEVEKLFTISDLSSETVFEAAYISPNH